jgi:hypothetical protein
MRVVTDVSEGHFPSLYAANCDESTISGRARESQIVWLSLIENTTEVCLRRAVGLVGRGSLSVQLCLRCPRANGEAPHAGYSYHIIKMDLIWM